MTTNLLAKELAQAMDELRDTLGSESAETEFDRFIPWAMFKLKLGSEHADDHSIGLFAGACERAGVTPTANAEVACGLLEAYFEENRPHPKLVQALERIQRESMIAGVDRDDPLLRFEGRQRDLRPVGGQPAPTDVFTARPIGLFAMQIEASSAAPRTRRAKPKNRN